MYDLIVVGAGPIGVEAALRARKAELDVLVLEKGRVGEHLRQWCGVTMFTPFSMNRSSRAVDFAGRCDLDVPGDDEYLTGPEYVQRWLNPLAGSTPLSGTIHTGVTVRGIAREGFDKQHAIGSPRRARSPFRVLARRNGHERVYRARCVLDASGTFGCPNPTGSGGLPAPGETELGDRIERRFPPRERIESWRGDSVLLVGAGYSAATNLLRMTGEDGEPIPGRLHWLLRRETGPPLTSIEDDPLPRRRRLAEAANQRAASGSVELIRGSEVDRMQTKAGRIHVGFTDGGDREVDVVVSNTGYRPDRRLHRELQVHECYATEGPIDLAAGLMDQKDADCLEVEAGGAELLKLPEPNFYLVGSRAFGRRANFLLETGFEQLNDLFGGLIDGAG